MCVISAQNLQPASPLGCAVMPDNSVKVSNTQAKPPLLSINLVFIGLTSQFHLTFSFTPFEMRFSLNLKHFWSENYNSDDFFSILIVDTFCLETQIQM